MLYSDKAVVLTGVGRKGQVGEFVAHAFARLGAHVIAVDRDDREVRERAVELTAAGLRAEGRACDLTDEAQVSALAGDVSSAHGGRIAALVHLAGGFAMSGPVVSSDLQVWHRLLAINVTSACLTTRAFIPLLRPARGAIVYFASSAALPGADGAGMWAYAAAKSGVLALMRAVAAEERVHGVRANAVAPSAIRTADNLATMGESARYVEREDVTATVLFLCSDEAAAITGQVVALT